MGSTECVGAHNSINMLLFCFFKTLVCFFSCLLSFKIGALLTNILKEQQFGKKLIIFRYNLSAFK